MTRVRLFIFALLLVSLAGCIEPSSTKLHNNFFAHKSEFAQLLQLYKEAKGTLPENLLKMQSIEKTVGVSGATYVTECLIWFQSYTTESTSKGIDKGYAHLCTAPANPDLIVQDIDHYALPKELYYTAYQKLEDNWYF